MINRDKVTSGFDTETLVSESYLTYLLLAQIEAGLLPLQFEILAPLEGIDVTVLLHPPQDYKRLYTPEPTAELPPAMAQTFEVKLLPGNNTAIESVAFSPDDTMIASGAADGNVRLWDAETGVGLNTLSGHFDAVTSVAFSPDGTRVVSGAFDRMIRLWDASNGTELDTLIGHSDAVESVAFSPDGTRIVSGSRDHTVRLWNAQTGIELMTLSGHTGLVFDAAFSPDGTQIASCSLDKTVRLWDAQTGDELMTFNGHTGFVNTVAFSPDGTRIASGAEDRTIRIWDVASGTELRSLRGDNGPVNSVTFSPDGALIAAGSNDEDIRLWDANSGALVDQLNGHRRPVRSVAFNSDGTQLVSGSWDAKIRLWDTESGDELAAIAIVFMRLTVQVTVIDNQANEEHGPFPANLLIDLDIEADESDGLERNHALRLALARLDPATATLLEAFGIDPQLVEERIKEQLDRAVPLGVAQGQQVQQIRLQKLFDGPEPSIGFYVDLAIRSGPEPDKYLPPRGNLRFAQNFRDPLAPLAFATSPDLFALLGPDAKFRQAEKTSSGKYIFPLREDPLDPESDQIGKIKGITVGPHFVGAVNTGRLVIDVHGEYTDAPGDPDFHLQLFFIPKIDNDGLLEWDLDVDVDLGLLATLLLVAGGIVLTVFFAPGAALGSSLIIGSFLGLAVLKELIAEPLAAKIVADRLDVESQASFLDALPFRLPAAHRRWDPFYLTHHQVVSLVDSVTIDKQGIAFEATGRRLGKEPQAIDHVVIRDEQRAGGGVAGLRYRVRDFARIASDLEANAPGRDRMDFSRLDPTNEPTLVTLTNDQMAERIASKRLLAPISYKAERIYLVDNQIDGLLCLSLRERAEQRRRLIDEFRAETKQQIRDDEGDDIRDEVIAELEQKLGRTPTTREINDAVDKQIEARVDELQPDFIENDLPDLLEDAIAQILRFDLTPQDLIAQQLAGVLLLDGKEIITRHNEDGTTTIYYRDHPDGDPRDNLLNLPHYTPPYEPPE